MYIAIDDTDSRGSMCTTYVAYKIIERISEEADIIGYPKLVRLNPNIPWKTRGNGAVSIAIGKGSGHKNKIGKIRDECIFSYSRLCKEVNINTLDSIIEVIERYRESSSNTGFIVVQRKPPEKFYYTAVRKVVADIPLVEGICLGWGNKRGLIGAYASLAWRARRKTYECIAYIEEKLWNINRGEFIIDVEIIKKLEKKYRSLFDCYDYHNEYAVMIPRTKTPVLFGVRGLDPRECLMSAEEIIAHSKVNVEGYILYMTNQATDDHISRKRTHEILQYDSVRVRGVVSSDPRWIEGGHVIFRLKDKYGEIYCAAYEPTKNFREVISNLRTGDVVEVYGGVANYPKTINIEKIRIIKVVRKIERNPLCKTCMVRMESRGKDKGYRCPKCRRIEIKKYYEVIERNITPGYYDVPPIARRHLTRPFFLSDRND